MMYHMNEEKNELETTVLRPKHLTINDIKDGCITLYGDNDEETKLCMMQEELRQGIDTLQSYNPSVTFYGSARLKEDNPDYVRARKLAYRISKELGCAVLSGGGPGIMEAANRGAYEAGGKSIGLTIKLPTEQHTNKYITEEIPFYFFFGRKTAMHYTTQACIYCAGGFGTFDELFEMITLKQTNKIGNVPIILYGTEFWNPIIKIIKEILVDKYNTVFEKELSLFTLTDDENEVIRIIKNAKPRDGQDAFQ